MASREHLALIRRGAEAVAAWRERHPRNRLDLSDAPLRRAELHHEDLSNADFRNACLEWADLRWTDLMHTDFSHAKLVQADLHKSDLRNAGLRFADLTDTNLEDADLTDADVTGAIFERTRLRNTKIVKTVGLRTVEHRGASVIDNDTLMRSGHLPDGFLRGCGLYAPFQAAVYRVAVGSPSDVQAERMRVQDVIYNWNNQNSWRHRVVLLPALWETHSTPTMKQPQRAINEQIIDPSQILIAVFWSRLGTPTAKAEAGTVEEIKRCVKDGKPVLLYFCTRRLPQDFDQRQWKRLQSFKRAIMKKALIDEFKSCEELDKKVRRHLTNIVDKLHPLHLGVEE